MYVLSSSGNHRRFLAAHGSAKCHCTLLTSRLPAPSALGTVTAAHNVPLLARPLPCSEVSAEAHQRHSAAQPPAVSSFCPPSHPGNCHFRLCYSSALELLKCSPASTVTFHSYQFLVKISSLLLSLAVAVLTAAPWPWGLLPLVFAHTPCSSAAW